MQTQELLSSLDNVDTDAPPTNLSEEDLILSRIIDYYWRKNTPQQRASVLQSLRQIRDRMNTQAHIDNVVDKAYKWGVTWTASGVVALLAAVLYYGTSVDYIGGTLAAGDGCFRFLMDQASIKLPEAIYTVLKACFAFSGMTFNLGLTLATSMGLFRGFREPNDVLPPDFHDALKAGARPGWWESTLGTAFRIFSTILIGGLSSVPQVADAEAAKFFGLDVSEAVAKFATGSSVTVTNGFGLWVYSLFEALRGGHFIPKPLRVLEPLKSVTNEKKSLAPLHIRPSQQADATQQAIFQLRQVLKITWLSGIQNMIARNKGLFNKAVVNQFSPGANDPAFVFNAEKLIALLRSFAPYTNKEWPDVRRIKFQQKLYSALGVAAVMGGYGFNLFTKIQKWSDDEIDINAFDEFMSALSTVLFVSPFLWLLLCFGYKVALAKQQRRPASYYYSKARKGSDAFNKVGNLFSSGATLRGFCAFVTANISNLRARAWTMFVGGGPVWAGTGVANYAGNEMLYNDILDAVAARSGDTDVYRNIKIATRIYDSLLAAINQLDNVTDDEFLSLVGYIKENSPDLIDAFWPENLLGDVVDVNVEEGDNEQRTFDKLYLLAQGVHPAEPPAPTNGDGEEMERLNRSQQEIAQSQEGEGWGSWLSSGSWLPPFFRRRRGEPESSLHDDGLTEDGCQYTSDNER